MGTAGSSRLHRFERTTKRRRQLKGHRGMADFVGSRTHPPSTSLREHTRKASSFPKSEPNLLVYTTTQPLLVTVAVASHVAPNCRRRSSPSLVARGLLLFTCKMC